MALRCRVIGSRSAAHGLCFLEETLLREHADPPRRVACDDEVFVVRRLYGSVEADVARGLALRMDHGSQYLFGPLPGPASGGSHG